MPPVALGVGRHAGLAFAEPPVGCQAARIDGVDRDVVSRRRCDGFVQVLLLEREHAAAVVDHPEDVDRVPLAEEEQCLSASVDARQVVNDARKLAIERRSAKVASWLGAAGPGGGRGEMPAGAGDVTAGPSGNPPVNVSTACSSRRVLPVKSSALAVLVRPRNTYRREASFAAKCARSMKEPWRVDAAAGGDLVSARASVVVGPPYCDSVAIARIWTRRSARWRSARTTRQRGIVPRPALLGARLSRLRW